jgi:hypothetical protein
MITVRHRDTHEGRPFVVWQQREPGFATRYAATFDIDRESVKPDRLEHPTMFKAIDAMTTPHPEPREIKQLNLWD